MSGLRVLAAMSGGVDSATAAARAVDAGHEVTGVHLALSANPSSYRTGARGCCTLEDARDARRAADVIGIPFYVWDMAERFHRDVVRGFRGRVRRGPHPEPVPALQREDQVRRGARPRAGPRLRRGVHRALRADPCRDPAPGRGSRQGPVLRAGRAHLRAAQPRHVPARRHAQGRGPRRGRAARARGRGQAGQPRRLLHRRRRHQGLPGPAPGPGPRPDRRPVRRRPRRARRRLRLHRRPAPRPARRHARPATAGPATYSTSSR